MFHFRLTCVAQNCLCLSSVMSTLQYTGRYQLVLLFTRGFCDGSKLRRADLDMFLCHFLAQCEQVLKLYRITFRADIKNSSVYCGHNLTSQSGVTFQKHLA